MSEQYKPVKPTSAEVLKYTAAKGYRPVVGMVECTYCGKRIWNSGLGRGAHNRSKACADGQKAVTLTTVQEAELRYFADPTPKNNAKRGRVTTATWAKLGAAKLIVDSDAFPFHTATDAGHDWIEAKDDAVGDWVARVRRDPMGSGDTATADHAAEIVRKALAILSTTGRNPAHPAAMLRALDAKYPPVTVVELATPFMAPAEMAATLQTASEPTKDDLVKVSDGTNTGDMGTLRCLSAPVNGQIKVAPAGGGQSWWIKLDRLEIVTRAAVLAEFTDPPRFPEGTPEHAAYRAELTTELDKFAAGEGEYAPEPALKVGDVVKVIKGVHKHLRSRIKAVNPSGKLGLDDGRGGRVWLLPTSVRKISKRYEITTSVRSTHDDKAWQVVATETTEEASFYDAKGKLPAQPDGLEPGTQWRIRLTEPGVSGRVFTETGITPNS